MNRLLLLEDDESLIEGLAYTLKKEGFILDVVRSLGEAKIKQDADSCYDLLLLDVTLPDGSGFELCESIREKGDMTPIIFLTASDEETSVIRGLDCGGDDYITKPFKLGELCSRIRALLRRSAMQEERREDCLTSGPVRVDTAKGKVFLRDERAELTLAEYRLLVLFLQHKGRILTRDFILNALWDGRGSYVDDNTLSVYIRHLREKLEKDPSNPQYLITVRGMGYRWEVEKS